MTRIEAMAIHGEARRQGLLAIWTVSHNTADFGELYVCRPHLVGAGMQGYLRKHLVADDLQSLRKLLPPGLTRMTPSAEDDPVIVELWL